MVVLSSESWRKGTNTRSVKQKSAVNTEVVLLLTEHEGSPTARNGDTEKRVSELLYHLDTL